jgi:hypothetical protein
VEGQQHRRFIKIHLPVDALLFSAKAKTYMSAAMAATWSGSCITITSMLMIFGIRR